MADLLAHDRAKGPKRRSVAGQDAAMADLGRSEPNARRKARYGERHNFRRWRHNVCDFEKGHFVGTGVVIALLSLLLLPAAGVAGTGRLVSPW
jgi:hypothetical protein